MGWGDGFLYNGDLEAVVFFVMNCQDNTGKDFFAANFCECLRIEYRSLKVNPRAASWNGERVVREVHGLFEKRGYKMKKTMVVSFVFLLVQTLTAEVIVFNQDAVLNGDYDAISIEGDAEVSITGGTIEMLYVLDNAIVNFTSGRVKRLFAYDGSIVYASGDAQGHMSADYYFFGNSVLVVSDSANLLYTAMLNSSTLILNGGYIQELLSKNNTVSHLMGGEIGRLILGDCARANISGTNIEEFDSGEGSPNNINTHIYGNNLSAQPYGGNNILDGSVSGFWPDNTPFQINMDEMDGRSHYSRITLHEGGTPPDPFATPSGLSQTPLGVQILSYNLKQGKTTGTDKLIISGRLNVPANLNLADKDMVIECGSYLEAITVPEGKNGVFCYKAQRGTEGNVSLAIFDLSKGTFKIAILNADLSDANPGEFHLWVD